MSKYQKFFRSEVINTNGHWAVGVEWTVAGSKNNMYNVEMSDRGFSCNCPAFKKCKHITAIEERFCYE